MFDMSGAGGGGEVVFQQLSEEELIDILRKRTDDDAPQMAELLKDDALIDMMGKHHQADLKRASARE